MKTDMLKKLIKEAVREAIQEEIKQMIIKNETEWIEEIHDDEGFQELEI